uniref:MAM domain-containing glycosylphosphatidylinositol anchor protein 1 n=1 Tax=Dicentrarchus labrax TaxID=13489 RepID=E6ZH37_DICLA|nr:MAM domain-containing glycosylphosphatidylinositol anchor protein 1 [Dicentrarchus labrax]
MQCKVLFYVGFLTFIKHASPSEIVASPNTNATLPCNVTFPLSVTGDKIDKSLIKVSWISNGSDIASFSEAATQIKEGFSWDTSDFVNGDFSLTVLRAGLDLQGLYKCTVGYNFTMLQYRNVTLSILASPTLSIPQLWVVLETESHLKCHADGFYPPPVYFSWTRDGQVIQPPYDVEGEQSPDGYYMAVGNLTFYPSREDQNVTFGCKVSHNGSYQELDFQLNVTYPPSVTLSALPSRSNNIPLTLYCDVEGFYPEEVSVSWLQNGTVLSEPPATEQNPDGTYRTRRYYTLTPEQRDQSGKVECAVNQPGGLYPVSGSAYLEKLDPQDEPPVLTKSAKASVALMCISLVLVFLLCFGFSWRRRDEKQKSLSVSGIILPPRVIVGQKGRVTVSIEGRRVDRVQTAWFLNDTPITDTSFTVSEKGPLLSSRGEMGYYKLHTQGPLHSSGSGTQQLISSLTFIPQISVHKGAVFKCQVSYIGKDKIVEERVSEKFTILFNMLNIPSCERLHPYNFCLSEVISMTVRASHFHPDVITFRWFCEGGELSPVASQASSSPRPNSEGFFSAFSQCKLPQSELEKGGTKVWVSVHHIALKQPVTRETRGFIKRPCMSEIVSSTSATDQTLGCEITDFHPPNISVTWLKLRDGEQDDREEEVIEGGEMWGPIQTHPRLYRATAILKRRVTNPEKKERGGGVICRVEHCSLPEPIERHWRNVDIETRAAVTDPDAEGIEYIDGENNNIDRDEETKSEVDEDSDKEKEDDPGALHINRVSLRRSPRENERAPFRVCVEITHPALKLPVYRTWTVGIKVIWSESQRGGRLKMDNDIPPSRVERTFWTVWVSRCII